MSTLYGWAIPVGIFVGIGLIILYARMEEETQEIRDDRRDVVEAPKRGESPAEKEPKGPSLRTILDVSFLVLILAATAGVVMYEYKIDPVVAFARTFPSETRFIENIMRRLRAPLF